MTTENNFSEADDFDYEKKLKALPENAQEKKEKLDELKIHAALSHDREVDSELVTTWIENAKKGHKTRYKLSSSRWQYVAASLVLIFPIVGLLVMSLNFEIDPVEMENTIVVITEMVEKDDGANIVSKKTIKPLSPFPPPKISIAKSEIKDIIEEEVVLNESKEVDMLSSPSLAISSADQISSIKNMNLSGKRIAPQPQRSAKRQIILMDEAPIQSESYHAIEEKGFVMTANDRQSTISVDVDTASYSNIRRHIRSGNFPPRDSVRLEEMINYFQYEYPEPTGEVPFSVTTKLEPNLWNTSTKILSIGLQAKRVVDRPLAHLVFLLDVSGSMNNPDKLPLLKRGFKLMLNNLNPKDRVSIVAYAGHTGVVLMPTSVSERSKIDDAIDQLVASGSTNGEGGIQLAYRLAKDHFLKDGINRVILATDGDFNVGLNGVDQLQDFIAKKRETGIELSVLGFGQGNIKDDIMERLADHGNGNYAYIDSIAEARKALVSQLSSTLVTVAKDVKLQLSFNPEIVKSFRQIGYENRTLAHRDFDDDKKDAGEIGAGHSVTALYEIEFHEGHEGSSSLGQLSLRYKQPKAEESLKIDYHLSKSLELEKNASWASVISAFGQKLKHSEFVSKLSYQTILEEAQRTKGQDKYGYRSEAISLIQQVSDLLGTKAEPVGDYPEWKVRK